MTHAISKAVMLLVAYSLVPSTKHAPAQTAADAPRPSFEAATIKPRDLKSNNPVSFHSDPGGRVYFGGDLHMLIEQAFNLRTYQVEGGPAWISSQSFEINAVPPDSSASRNIKIAVANPSPEQCLMLQSLLADRFGFKYHMTTKEGSVYVLARGKKPLQLKPPKDPNQDPRAIVLEKQHGIFDGEALGRNATMDYLATRLGDLLQLPVLNETGINGSYDFDLVPDDPENLDRVEAGIHAVERLGLKLKRGRGPVRTLVIDSVAQPSEN